MSRTYIPIVLRQSVIERAGNRCEYCLYPQHMSFITFECEHIVAEKHGGATVADNLALACPFCNRFKGTDLGSLDPVTKILTPFFNPRLHTWNEHVQLVDAYIEPLTAEGRVTAIMLQLKHPDRLVERQLLIDLGLYP